MTAMLRVPRTRGVLSGVLLILLGAWGALIPFIGPYFHFAYTPDVAWTYTVGRFWLEILPGVVTAIGGLILLVSAFRPAAMVGACLAAAAGVWFALGSLVAPLWTGYGTVGPYAIPAALYPGTPVGGPVHLVAERLAYFTGLGVVIVAIAAVAFGRLTVVGAREAQVAASRTAVEEPVTASTAAASTAPASRLPRRIPLRRAAASPKPADSPKPVAETEGESQRTSVFRRLVSARSPGDGSEES
jgi:hypothetical protein